MPVNLKLPLEWKKADPEELEMLGDLQCNILKGHGRRQTQQIFLRFKQGEAEATINRKYIQEVIATAVVSQLKQLKDSDALRHLSVEEKQERLKESNPIIAFFLSHTGYQSLGITDKLPTPTDDAFVKGMKKRVDLKDDIKNFEEYFKGDIDAMLLIADANQGFLVKRLIAFLRSMPSSIEIVGTEIGNQQEDGRGEGVEHFGYVDGRSQPLLLVEDIRAEMKDAGIEHVKDFKWDPSFGINTALVRDKAGKSQNSYGSYFVFRKLEQNVKAFKDKEQFLGNKLDLGEDREIAGAFIVGRFEDGTPVILSDKETGVISNNFNFKNDPNGAKCPFASHVRKTNPRGDSVKLSTPESKVTLKMERSHIMARRGITYGERWIGMRDRPTKDVGLLFMAYQRNISEQFEFTQQSWVNDPDALRKETGIDPVLGQVRTGEVPPAQKWPSEYGKSENPVSFDFHGFVTTKGGEYFFAPSISMLKSLEPQQ